MFGFLVVEVIVVVATAQAQDVVWFVGFANRLVLQPPVPTPGKPIQPVLTILQPECNGQCPITDERLLQSWDGAERAHRAITRSQAGKIYRQNLLPESTASTYLYRKCS